MSRDDLITFLKARLDDDEAHARNAFENDYADTKPEWSEIWSGTVNTGDELIYTNDKGLSRHIERWDPKRVLAEVDAKREIITVCDGTIGANANPGAIGDAEYVLQLMALPFSDHPDYRKEWTP
jgi:hypothetical protein